jgi:hypothetical protein
LLWPGPAGCLFFASVSLDETQLAAWRNAAHAGVKRSIHEQDWLCLLLRGLPDQTSEEAWLFRMPCRSGWMMQVNQTMLSTGSGILTGTVLLNDSDTVLLPHEVLTYQTGQAALIDALNWGESHAGELLLPIPGQLAPWPAAVSTEKPGSEMLGCLARMVSRSRTESGETVCVLKGLERVRYLPQPGWHGGLLFAEVRSLPTEPLLHDLPEGPSLARRLRELLIAHFPFLTASHAGLLLEMELTLGALCDVVAALLPTSMTQRIRVLEELQVCERARYLIGLLATPGLFQQAVGADFGPGQLAQN